MLLLHILLHLFWYICTTNIKYICAYLVVVRFSYFYHNNIQCNKKRNIGRDKYSVTYYPQQLKKYNIKYHQL